MSRRLTYVLVVGAAVVVALFVWPTLYREYCIGATTARVNRFTGRTDILMPYGWEPQRRPPAAGADTSTATRTTVRGRKANGRCDFAEALSDTADKSGSG